MINIPRKNEFLQDVINNKNKNNYDFHILIDGQDYSNYITSIDISGSEISDDFFTPIVGQAKISLNGNWYDELKNKTHFLIYIIYKDEQNYIPVFGGIIDKDSFEIYHENVKSTTTFNALDYSILLKKKEINNEYISNYKFYDPSDLSHSLVYYLISKVDNTLTSRIDIPTDTSTVKNVVLNGTIFDILTQLFASKGYVWSFSSGFLRRYPIVRDNYNPDINLNDFYTQEIALIAKDNKNIKLNSTDFTQKMNDELYIFTLKDVSNSTNECAINLPGNTYKPSETGWYECELSDDVISVDENSITHDILFSTPVSYAIDKKVVIDKNKIKILLRIKNNSSQSTTILKWRVKGTSVRKSKENVYIGVVDSQYNEYKEYNNIFLDDRLGNELSIALSEREKSKEFYIKTSTYFNPLLEVGDIVYINTNLMSGTFYLSEVKHTIDPEKCETELGFFNIGKPVVDYQQEHIINNTGVDSNIYNNVVSSAINQTMTQLSPSNNQGINDYGWTTNPNTPVIKSLRTRNNLILIEIAKQTNLSNFDKYILQYSTDDGLTWSSEIDYYNENINLIVPFNTDTSGKNLDTNVKIRIKQVTKNGVQSGYRITDNITLTPQLSSISNNLGDVFADSIYFDSNNFISPGSFKLGDNTNYIQFMGNQLTLANSKMQITDDGLHWDQGTILSKNGVHNNIEVENLYLDYPVDDEGYPWRGLGGYGLLYLDPDSWYILGGTNEDNITVKLYKNSSLLLNKNVYNAQFFPYRTQGEFYIFNGDYNETIDITNTYNSPIVFLKGGDLYLSWMDGYNNYRRLASKSLNVPAGWNFYKKDNKIYSNYTVIQTQPSFSARINVGENLIVDYYDPSGFTSFYIPLIICDKDIYKFFVITNVDEVGFNITYNFSISSIKNIGWLFNEGSSSLTPFSNTYEHDLGGYSYGFIIKRLDIIQWNQYRYVSFLNSMTGGIYSTAYKKAKLSNASNITYIKFQTKNNQTITRVNFIAERLA